MKTTKTPDYKDAYANNADFTITRWDILMRFGIMSKPANGTDRDWLIDSFQGIHMSPVFAKEFHKFLGENIKTYEVAFGEIKNEIQQEQKDAILASYQIGGPAQ